ncbi:MAG: endonuclease domain-containing protein [Methylobacterium sp.]|nr:MAG: endonuclease domain-containing protein [Methylobacterium sp.]
MNRPAIFALLGQRVSARKIHLARQLRQQMTPAEATFWKHLRGSIRARRQVLIAGYIADFYCSALRLVIEIDGPVHDHQREYDRQRDEVMRGLGLQVIRITNEDVLRDPPGAVRQTLTQARQWVDERKRLDWTVSRHGEETDGSSEVPVDSGRR